MQNKKVVTFGEIMLRLATPQHLRFNQVKQFNASFGGGESNVAVSLANFGVPVSFVTRLPENDIGTACLQELRKHNVDTSHILRGGERLGVYFLETGAVSRGSKVIYDRFHSAVSQVEKGMFNWKEIFKDATWFHWTGITPAISQGTADVCQEAIEAANELGLTVSCDLNYRKKLWKYGKDAQEVMPELVKGCDIVLGNEEDAEKSLGIKPEGVDVTKGEVDAEAYRSVSRQIMERFPKAKKVITTLRGSINANHNTWTGTLYDGEKLHIGNKFDITHIVDRVGGGDAFMAGLIYGILSEMNDEDALNFGIASSCLKHTVHGDFNEVTVDEVKKIMGGDVSGRVSR
ncbi:MAG: sugar kinase [Bacteroidales bacterium]|nr:sugar kinase [Bacteroidales bacterium]